jgi:flagellar hook-associated protein 1 FlgK
MSAGILNVGISGLNVAQAGILTTSHNISNASTPGFSRQEIIQTTNVPMFTGAGFLGQGSNVSTVKRIYSQFLNNQVLSAQTGVSQADAYLAQINQIDNLLADPSAGLQPALSAFFSGVNDVAANPASTPSRQSMLSSAQALTARFQAINQRLTEVRDGINTQINGSVTNINALATQLADVNQRIVLAQASSILQPANDLLDQRDQLIADLNKEIRATTITQNDGTYSVFIGNGQPLVVGVQAFSIKAMAAPEDPSRIVVAMQAPGGNTIALQESLLTGGTLGGLISFRSQMLDPVQNALGRVAIGLAQNVNLQHQLGWDLTGHMGTAFFNVASPAVQPSSANTGGATLTASLANIAADPVTDAPSNTVANLTTSDYRLSFDGFNYNLIRLSDNASWTTAGPILSNWSPGMPVTPGAPATPQGFTLSGATAPAAGDTFLISPTRNGARDISVLVNDPRNIAAASPMRTAAALTNTGAASINAGSITNATDWNSSSKNLAVKFWTAPPSQIIGSVDISAGLPGATGSGITLTAPNNTFNISIDGSTPPTLVSVTPGTYGGTQPSLVAAVQSAIDAKFAPGSATVRAITAGNGKTYLEITSNGPGTNANVSLPDNPNYIPGMAALFGTTSAVTYYDLLDMATPNPNPTSLFTGSPSALGGSSYTHLYSPGVPITFSGLDPAYNDFGATVTVTGRPANGDMFSLTQNSSGVSDNRNIIAIGLLQSAKELSAPEGGGAATASFTSAYAQIVSSVGNKTREVTVTGQAQQSLLESATLAQQSMSGVNLDEEAANLLRYQQAYQAAAKLMATASKLFDSILALG